MQCLEYSYRIQENGIPRWSCHFLVHWEKAFNCFEHHPLHLGKEIQHKYFLKFPHYKILQNKRSILMTENACRFIKQLHWYLSIMPTLKKKARPERTTWMFTCCDVDILWHLCGAWAFSLVCSYTLLFMCSWTQGLENFLHKRNNLEVLKLHKIKADFQLS